MFCLLSNKFEFTVINNNLTALNDGGNIEDFHIGEDGKAYITYKVGADTVTKKLGSGNFEKITVLAKKAQRLK